MKKATPALLALAVALAGCPIPQPLPDYPPGTVTPPRILMATVQPASGAVIRVGTDCTYPDNQPSFELSASIFDSDAIEPVVARWFVNYDMTEEHPSQTPIGGDRTVLGNSDPTVLVRVMTDTPFAGNGHAFYPYLHAPPDGTGTRTGVPYNEAGTVRVVELLVSNNFQPEPSSPKSRQPAPNYEVGLHRWVFLLVPGTENCGPHLLQ